MSRVPKNADRLWSLVVRVRDRACQRCGRLGAPNADGLPVDGLEAAHIFRRAYGNTRLDERNGIALCGPCHREFTVGPVMAWWTWARDHVGQQAFDLLSAKAASLDRPDWPADTVELRDRLAALRRSI